MLIFKIILFIIIWNLFLYQYYKIKYNNKPKKKLSDIKAVSFSGAGYYITYYIGIYKGLLELIPNIEELKFSGFSAGAILCLLCILRLNPKKELKRILTISKFQKNKNLINKFYIKEWIENYIKHFYKYKKEIINNKDRINIGVSTFNNIKFAFEEFKYELTENNLFEIILSSAHIPFITDNKIFKLNNTIDGYFSKKKLIDDIDDNNILYIGLKNSCRCNYDIAFENNNYYVNIIDTIIPKNKKDLIDLYKKGYNDIINYFLN